MAGFCSCGQFGHRSESECTLYTNLAREAELNSGRQEKLPFAQLVLKPTIAGNAYPGKLVSHMPESGNNSYYDAKYGVHVPAGGSIKIELVEEFDEWVRVIVISKDGIVQRMRHMRKSEIMLLAKKYTDVNYQTAKFKPYPHNPWLD